MRSSSPWIIALSVRLYRWLLGIGPREFRSEFGPSMIQVFRQCCRDAYQQRGAGGVIGLWLPAFSELVIGMLAEHLSPEEAQARSLCMKG